MAGTDTVTICHGMTKPPSWLSLPAEIRLQILGVIAQHKQPGWAALASVCKEWQFFMEERNFHLLELRVSCLDDFERLVIQQGRPVQHIRFEIELPEYACDCYERDPREDPDADLNMLAIREGIWKLFRVLSTWKPTNGVTLELNAYSPHDTDHWFKNFYFSTYDEDEQDEISPQDTHCNWHDPEHGWVNGQQVTRPPPGIISRLFGVFTLQFPEELPRVDCVTRLIIHRQLRCWFYPDKLWLILGKLVGLEHLIYEPWRLWDRYSTKLYDQRRYCYCGQDPSRVPF